MKKIVAGLVLALMVAALPLSLVGCKKGNNAGKYLCEELTVSYTDDEDEEYILSDDEDFQWIKNVYIKLNSNGTADTNLMKEYMIYINKRSGHNYSDDVLKVEQNITWKVKGNKLYVDGKCKVYIAKDPTDVSKGYNLEDDATDAANNIISAIQYMTIENNQIYGKICADVFGENRNMNVNILLVKTK